MLNEQVRVTVDGWSCAAGYAIGPDEHGCVWDLVDIDGWFGGLAVRSATEERAQADGDWDGDPYFEARRVTVSGSVLAPTRVALQEAMDRIANVLARGTRRGILVVDEISRGLSRQVPCRLDVQGKAQRKSPNAADFEITLYCPDPERLSTAVHSVTISPYQRGEGRAYPLEHPRVYGALGASGRVMVTNLGDNDAWPVLTIDGYAVNPFVQLVGGDRIKYVGTVQPGQPIVIDTRAMTAYIGAASRGHLLSADSAYWPLPPGDSELFFGDDEGDSARLTVGWRDTWA